MNYYGQEPGYSANQQIQGNYAMAGAGPICAPPVDPPRQISVSIEILSKEVAFLHDTLGQLEHRLSPMMSLSGPEKDSAAKEVAEPTCPMANHIAQLARSVSTASRILQSIIRRVEA